MIEQPNLTLDRWYDLGPGNIEAKYTGLNNIDESVAEHEFLFRHSIPGIARITAKVTIKPENVKWGEHPLQILDKRGLYSIELIMQSDNHKGYAFDRLRLEADTPKRKSK